MKTMIPSFVTAVASVTFAGCAKYETSYAAYDTADEKVEITFQLAPLSKASDANFSTACVFQTNAFYHPEDSRWTTHASDSREHMLTASRSAVFSAITSAVISVSRLQ